MERTEAACTRCHKVGGVGGEVGPALPTADMLKHKDRRRYALESIVVPNKDVAKGFDQVVLQLKDETTETGRIERESGTEVVLILPDGKRRTIAAADIAARQRGKSAMPEDLIQKLSKRDLRNLVEYLVELKAGK